MLCHVQHPEASWTRCLWPEGPSTETPLFPSSHVSVVPSGLCSFWRAGGYLCSGPPCPLAASACCEATGQPTSLDHLGHSHLVLDCSAREITAADTHMASAQETGSPWGCFLLWVVAISGFVIYFFLKTWCNQQLPQGAQGSGGLSPMVLWVGF